MLTRAEWDKLKPGDRLITIQTQGIVAGHVWEICVKPSEWLYQKDWMPAKHISGPNYDPSATFEQRLAYGDCWEYWVDPNPDIPKSNRLSLVE